MLYSLFQMIEEDELFNPEYVEVDRVLSESRFPPPEDAPEEPEAVYFLCKWRQLPYEDATWELEPDVDKTSIAKYFKYKNPPAKVKVSDENTIPVKCDELTHNNVIPTPSLIAVRFL